MSCEGVRSTLSVVVALEHELDVPAFPGPPDELDQELPGVIIRAEVHSSGKTGVEMEALTAVSVAAVTVYDMAKAVQKDIKILGIRLLEKSGGKSGDFRAPQEG